jgi:hypothetical protein
MISERSREKGTILAGERGNLHSLLEALREYERFPGERNDYLVEVLIKGLLDSF